MPVGRISGVYGLRGWVRVYSYTRPRHNIVQYRPWHLNRNGEWREYELAEGRPQGKGVVARLAGCCDRDHARELVGAEIGIRRAQLPDPPAGQYYWADLQGLTVVTLTGERLGTVEALVETGANDVMVVGGNGERLIPFVFGRVVVDVNLQRREIIVDWSKDF